MEKALLLFAKIGDKCDLPQTAGLFGFPTWYKYLPGVEEKRLGSPGQTECAAKLAGLGDIWLIVLAVIEILLRIAIIAAIAYVMIGGFKFVTSGANPDKTTSARNTVQDGLIGLLIAVTATAIVSFVAGRFQG